MFTPAVASIAVLVAAAILSAGFILPLPVLVTVGMILLPLAVLSGIPMWGRRV